MKVILSRTDNLGDVVLTLPMAGALKAVHPDWELFFLGKTYTKPLISACEAIDHFINWDELAALAEPEQIRYLADLGADAIVHVFPDKRVAKLAKRAAVRQRIGTSHRLWHWWTCNRLLHFSRKRSELHESQLNLKLLRPFGIEGPFSLRQIPDFYRLTRHKPLSAQVADLIDPHKLNLVFHPKSKGSAREWGLSRFAELARRLPSERFRIFVTGTADEGAQVREELLEACPDLIDMTGKMTLDELLSFLAACDGIVAASTGPLHMAAAVGTHALGLFAPIRPMHPGRWAPIGLAAEVLVEDKTCSDCRKQATCACIEAIEVARVAARIEQWEKHKKAKA
ncbi:Glycosyltransferase family 9 protein [Sulfidibacter corallicola]|uniref:Glycosyltransferase family 9 protein n=1 Tax=Sulfidibacter corallicola TaxID=2818388 RepID=A0A8A4TYA5_SULCO|nr:glycosyltransferase family 9 protein [Sulfidibacter corallicola]QTD53942.1 glycosyltransferase family 9 protein [Sulfidibacter corallicola]